MYSCTSRLYSNNILSLFLLFFLEQNIELVMRNLSLAFPKQQPAQWDPLNKFLQYHITNKMFFLIKVCNALIHVLFVCIEELYCSQLILHQYMYIQVSSTWRYSDLAELALQVLQVMTVFPQTHMLVATSNHSLGPEADVNVANRCVCVFFFESYISCTCLEKVFGTMELMFSDFCLCFACCFFTLYVNRSNLNSNATSPARNEQNGEQHDVTSTTQEPTGAAAARYVSWVCRQRWNT